MRAGFIQMTPEFGKIATNIELAEKLVRKTPADLLVLPEFFNTGYLFTRHEEVRRLSEPVPDGYTTQWLSGLSRETGTLIVAGLPETAPDGFYNSAVLVTPDGDVHLYRKTHLFDREKLFFTPGNTGFKVFKYREIRIGMMICFDWFFPESMRSLALSGAQIVAHPSNLVLPHCPRAMITRCLENRVFGITANRAGKEIRGGHQLEFTGNSRIIGPDSKVLGQAGDETIHCVVAHIDPSEADRKQVTERNHLFSDRRPEMYHQDLCRSIDLTGL